MSYQDRVLSSHKIHYADDPADDSFVCPSCGRVTEQTITCPTCHNECCIENCAPMGVNVECLACEEQRVFAENNECDLSKETVTILSPDDYDDEDEWSDYES